MNANSKHKAPVTVKEWLARAADRFKQAGVPSFRLDAELLLCHVLGKNRTWLIAHTDDSLKDEATGLADGFLKRREKREPLAYITGYKEFYGRNFVVSSDVLVPRPESEALIDLAKNCGLKPGDSILDVGTGSGCLGITLQCELPECEVTLLDVSESALDIARRNAHALDARVAFELRDIMKLERATKLQHAPYRLIVANLPYVDDAWKRSEETEYEPTLALFSEASGLWHYINFFSAALHFLAKGGYIIIEADPRQHDELIDYAAKLGFEMAVRDGFALLFARSPSSIEAAPGIVISR